MERTIRELRAERGRLDKAIDALESVSSTERKTRGIHAVTSRPKRHMSPAGRRRIAAAQRARWARLRARGKPEKKVA